MLARLRQSLIAVGDWGDFTARSAYWFLPKRFRARHGGIPSAATFAQTDRLAFGAIPLVSIVLFFVGMILALQLATILKLLGVIEYVPDIVAVAVVREMAPLLTGVVLSGYAGAAIAAEIGSMKVSDELEAMRSLALSPERFLVAPRLLAAAISGPLLTIFACYVGMAGGLVVSWLLLGISPGMYLQRTLDALNLGAVILGATKGLAFALIVTGISCYRGFNVTGGAVGVGKATTTAVVQSVVAVIAADLFLTVLFFHVE